MPRVRRHSTRRIPGVRTFVDHAPPERRVTATVFCFFFCFFLFLLQSKFSTRSRGWREVPDGGGVSSAADAGVPSAPRATVAPLRVRMEQRLHAPCGSAASVDPGPTEFSLFFFQACNSSFDGHFVKRQRCHRCDAGRRSRRLGRSEPDVGSPVAADQFAGRTAGLRSGRATATSRRSHATVHQVSPGGLCPRFVVCRQRARPSSRLPVVGWSAGPRAGRWLAEGGALCVVGSRFLSVETRSRRAVQSTRDHGTAQLYRIELRNNQFLIGVSKKSASWALIGCLVVLTSFRDGTELDWLPRDNDVTGIEEDQLPGLSLAVGWC